MYHILLNHAFRRVLFRKSNTKIAPEDIQIAQDVCATLLDLSKSAITRCKDLCWEKDVPELLQKIYFTLMDSLCLDHFVGTLDAVVQGIASLLPI